VRGHIQIPIMMDLAKEGPHEHFNDEERAQIISSCMLLTLEYGLFYTCMHPYMYCIGVKVCSVQYTVL